MSKRKVVVGLPVYNGERFLGAAIESHLSQSFSDFDLVISDNGSTDSTQAICEDYAKRDCRVIYWRSAENRGILWNHRRVMEAVERPDQYFRWAAADDIIEPGLLQVMVDVLDTRPDVEAVVPDTNNIDDEGKVTGSMKRALDLQQDDVVERAHGVLFGDYQMVIAFGLFRAGTLQKIRTSADYIGWDFVFNWELALWGKMVQPTGPVLLRRYHKGAMHFVKTAKEMKKWVEPNSNAGLIFPNWKWFFERLRALMHAPISRQKKLEVLRLLGRNARWGRDVLVRDITLATERALGLSDKYNF